MALPWFETEMKRLLNQPGKPMPPHEEELIPRLCRESGRWLVVRREGDCHIVQATDHRAVKEITVRDCTNSYTVLFQAWFPVRFPLDNPPSGLFGRVLMRNLDLYFSGWAVSIGGSCEACLTLAALVPRQALDARLFDNVCREVRDELIGFHQELHAKFLYAAPPFPASPPVRGDGGGQDVVRYLEPAEPPPAALPAAAEAWRIIQQQAGSVRRRLPKPGE